MSRNVLGADACGLGRAIEAGRTDPVEITEAYFDAIRSFDGWERIFARLTEGRALAEARAATERAKRGMRLSPLDGVPLSWKDLFDSAGIATEAGSALLKGRIPRHDAEVVRRATALGAVCLGKTHMSELAFSGLGVNPVTATPPCVNDPEAAPGGSSSGAAASVAFNLAAGAVGSDTGGSVRVPAAWNDLVGLKTSLGRLPMQGVVPLCRSFDTIGPLTRTVTDAAAMFSLLLGQVRPPAIEGVRLERCRFLILAEGIDRARREPLRSFESIVEKLRQAGAAIEHRRVTEVDIALGHAGNLYGAEAYGEWKDRIEADPDAMFAEVLNRFRSGRGVAGCDYVSSWNTLRDLRRNYKSKTAGFDAVLLPTSPILPPNLSKLLADSQFFARENLLALENTRYGNLMDVPALTIPTAVPSAGFMLLGENGQETRLLRVGRAVEKLISG
ncbi:MAG: amidase family protein [Rhodobacteraceae bacterium]|nr:amidase family protein [Paracoccaceae bacterium]